MRTIGTVEAVIYDALGNPTETQLGTIEYDGHRKRISDDEMHLEFKKLGFSSTAALERTWSGANQESWVTPDGQEIFTVSWREVRERYKWLVEIEVDEMWVADGFNLSDERLHQMLGRELQCAYSTEYSGKVIAAPDPAAIKKAQEES